MSSQRFISEFLLLHVLQLSWPWPCTLKHPRPNSCTGSTVQMWRCDVIGTVAPLVTYPDQTFTNCLASTRCWKHTHLLTKFLRFVRLVLVMPNTDFQLSQHLSFRNTTSARETHFSFADEPNTPISSEWKEAPTFSLQQLLAPNRGSRYLPPTGGIFFPRWAQIRGKHW